MARYDTKLKSLAGRGHVSTKAAAKASGPTLTQKQANYVSDWSNTKTQCHACSMFRKRGACTLVKGPISPQGHCDHFDAKG